MTYFLTILAAHLLVEGAVEEDGTTDGGCEVYGAYYGNGALIVSCGFRFDV